MGETINLTGGCLCGTVRYTVDSAPFSSEYCHCGMCRKSTGAPVAAWMDFLVEQVTWSQDAPTEYQSSASVFRGFCPHCGSTLTFRDSRHPKYLSLSVGSLDDPSQVTPTFHIYTESRVDWLQIDDDFPRFPEGPE